MRGKKIVYEISFYLTSRIFTNSRQLYPLGVTSGGSGRFNCWQANPPGSDIWWQWKVQLLAVNPPRQRHLVAVESSTVSSQLPLDLRFEQNGNLQVFLSGIGDTFVTLKQMLRKLLL